MREQDIIDAAKRLDRERGAELVLFGLDVGRVQDHSALSVLVRYVFPIETAEGILSRYYCVHLNRYPLETPYQAIEEDAELWWRWADAMPISKTFIVDMTGVGAPIVEGIRSRRVPAIGVTLTAGEHETALKEREYNVPKATLVTTLVRASQAGRVKGFPVDPSWIEFKNELDTFGYKLHKDTGLMTYESLDAKVHDDLVIAVALPVWYGERVMPFRTQVRAGEDQDDYAEYNPLAR